MRSNPGPKYWSLEYYVPSIIFTVKNLSAVFLDYTPLGIETMTTNTQGFTK